MYRNLEAGAAFTRKLQRPTEDVFDAIGMVSAPLAISTIAAFILWIPEQTREIYRVYMRDLTLGGRDSGVGQIEFGLLGLMIASVFIWLLARNLSVQFKREELVGRDTRGFALRWLPRLCGALMPFGAGLGMLAAADEIRAIPFSTLSTGGIDPRQADAAMNLTIVGSFMLLFSVLLVLYAFVRTYGKPSKYAQARKWLFYWRTAFVFVALCSGGIVLFSGLVAPEYSLPILQTLGAPAIFFYFVIVLSYFATLFSAVYERYGIPVLMLLAIWLVGLSWFDTNDNHLVQKVAQTELSVAPPKAKQAFLDWYQGRADREAYEKAGKPYPVFIVSAAGGGLYAAEYSAVALSRLQDACPGFSQHTLAISAVSGGGLGSAVFSGLMAGEKQIASTQMTGLDPCKPKDWTPRSRVSFETRAKDFLNGDFMTPIVGAGLFPDFAQRFWPWPIAAFDRGRMFEASLDAAWGRADASCAGVACNPFRKPFLGHWSPNGVAPALVLNATDVDAGYRVAIAPFIVSDVPDEYLALRDFHDTFMRVGPENGMPQKTAEAAPGRKPDPVGKVQDISLSAAVGLTARFPWIMPPASVEVPKLGRSRLLDGGIFENSGVETVTDLVNELLEFEVAPDSRKTAEARAAPWVKFHVVIISSYRLNRIDAPTRPTSPAVPAASKGVFGGAQAAEAADAFDGGGAFRTFAGEALSPIWAMLGTRVQRAGVASYRLFRQRGYDCGKAGQSEKCVEGGIRFLVLNHQDFRLPLGWLLSSYSRRVVGAHVGTPELCKPIDSVRDMFTAHLKPELRQEYTRRENNCTSCAVLTALRGEKFEGSGLCQR